MILRLFLLLFLFFSISAYSDGYIVPVSLSAGGDFTVLGLDEPIGRSVYANIEFEFNLDLVERKCRFRRDLGQIVCPDTNVSYSARLFDSLGFDGVKKEFVVTY